MQVKVIYPSDGSQENSRVEIMLDIPSSISNFRDKQGVAEWVWGYLQCHDDESLARMNEVAKGVGCKRIRSSMVGDVYVVDGEYFICDGTGFKKASESFATDWMKLTSTSRLMGVKFNVQQAIIEADPGMTFEDD